MSNEWLRKENPPQGVKYKERLSVLVKKKLDIFTLYSMFTSRGSLKNGIIISFIFTAGSEHTLSWIRILVLLPE